MKFKAAVSRRAQIAALKPGESVLFHSTSPKANIQAVVGAELAKHFISVNYSQKRVLILIDEFTLPIAGTILTRLK